MVKISNGIYKITFGEAEKHTPVQNLNIKMRDKELLKKDDSKNFPFQKKDISFKVMDSGTVLVLPFGENERIYGFGLQMKSFMQNGKKRTMRCNADPIGDAGDSHAPVPFYVSEKGYAILVDTFRNVSFYCGCSANKAKDQAIRVNEILGPDRFDSVYASKRKGADMLVHVPTAKGVSIYIFIGKDMLDCIERYNLFSGGGFVPPIWGLSTLYRYYWKGNGEELLKRAKLLKQDKMPISTIGFEPNWQSHSYSSSLMWNDTLFPNHGELLNELKSMGFYVNLWEQAFVDPSSPIFEEMKPYSGDYLVWNGLVPDFFDKNAQEVYCSIQQKLINEGVCGFKMDECDGSEMYRYNFSFPNCGEFPTGIDGEQYHNAMGIIMQSMENDLFHKRNQRTLGQVRASHALAANQPFVLYSDLYEQRDYMRALLNSGFSGLLWTPETRWTPTVKELIRRIQTNIISPQVCINAYQVPNFPWYQPEFEKNCANDFLENKEEITALCRKMFELRTSLIPYLYSAFYKYYLNGTPAFRALALDYIGDMNVTDIDDQVLVGDCMMAAPMMEFHIDTRDIYLPKGIWYDFFTKKRYEGGAWLKDFPVPLDIIPLFIKENSLFPFAKPICDINENTIFEVDFYSFGESTKTVLFEDDGKTFDYEKGMFSTLNVKFENEELKVERTGNADYGRYKFGKIIKIT